MADTRRSRLIMKRTSLESQIQDKEVELVRAHKNVSAQTMIKGRLDELKGALELIMNQLQDIDHRWIMEREHELEGMVYHAQTLDPDHKALMQDQIEELRARINKRKEATYGS